MKLHDLSLQQETYKKPGEFYHYNCVIITLLLLINETKILAKHVKYLYRVRWSRVDKLLHRHVLGWEVFIDKNV